jgi:carboxylesterase
MSRIIDQGQPFFFPGDHIGCLLIHGFTGAPREMRLLGEALAQDGRTVLAIRLFAHATRAEDMRRARWTDWVADAQDGLAMLEATCDRIVAIGLSMGGAISLLLAAEHSLAGAVGLSTPYALPSDARLAFAKLISFFVPGIGKGEPDWVDPRNGEGHLSYPLYPTRAIAELDQLLAAMRLVLPRVRAPVLLMQSKTDAGILPDSMPMIFNHLGSIQKQQVWLGPSGHVITRDVLRQQVFDAVAGFVASVLSPRP